MRVPRQQPAPVHGPSFVIAGLLVHFASYLYPDIGCLPLMFDVCWDMCPLDDDICYLAILGVAYLFQSFWS